MLLILLIVLQFQASSSQTEGSHIAFIKWTPHRSNATDVAQCSGTIVTDRVVATACHCLGTVQPPNATYWARPWELTILPGSLSCEWSTRDRSRELLVIELFVHPKCNIVEWPPAYDFAYIIAASSFNLSSNLPIRMYNPSIDECISYTCHISACPSVNATNRTVDKVRQIKGSLLDMQLCKKSLGDFSRYYTMFIERKNLCILPEREKHEIEPSWGEDGSGLICCGYLTGILSWRTRRNISDSKYPVFFSNIYFADTFFEPFVDDEVYRQEFPNSKLSNGCDSHHEQRTVIVVSVLVVVVAELGPIKVIT